MTRLRMRTGLVVLGVMAVTAVGCTGGGDTVISGVGNGGNFVGSSGVLERVARELADLEAIPAVTDEDLNGIFSALRRRALRGDSEASLVIARLAALQRAKDE